MGDAASTSAGNAAGPELADCRCVVLVARAAARPEPLLAGLSRRCGMLRVVHDLPGVMVELAEPGRRALVINEPQMFGRLRELYAAIRRHHPKVACWQFRSAGRDGKPELSNAEDTADWLAAMPSMPAQPTVHAKPPERIADTSSPNRARDTIERHRGASSSSVVAEPLLTTEELEMLLGPIEPSETPERSESER